MAEEEVRPEDLTDLEKDIVLWLRMMKSVDPYFPITKLSLARKFGRSRGEIEAAATHLHEDLSLIGPLIYDPQDIQLTEYGEKIADQLSPK